MVSTKKVLVTGPSGYIGAHVMNVLLKSGYTVRGTVRSPKRAGEIIAKYATGRGVGEGEGKGGEDVVGVEGGEGQDLSGLRDNFNPKARWRNAIN